MEIIKSFITVGLAAIVLATLSCQPKAESTPITSNILANTSAGSEKTQTDVSASNDKVNSPIRNVDFENFTFPETHGEEFGGLGPTILVDGKNSETGADLLEVEYGDVTNDGIEEAIVAVDPYSGGNTSSHLVFIYTPKNTSPRLLWSIETGDRAEGGFKRGFAEDGDLIIELFGADKFENDTWDYRTAEDESGGLCCPTRLTRFHFHFNGSKFVLAEPSRVFDLETKTPKNEN